MANVNSNESIVLEVGDNVDIDVQKVEGGYTIVTVSATAGGSGHTIAESGTPLTARTTLNFVNGLIASDDAGNDETEVRADYGAVTAETSFDQASSNGSATSVSRSDHTHGTPASPVTSLAKEGAAALTGAVTLSEGSNVTLTQVGNDIEVAATGAAGAPSDVDYLVGTASGGLSAEIVVGTSPGGELGGTWASPTVDATHSGSTHSAATDTHIADAADAHDASAISVDSTTLAGVGTDVQAVFEEMDNDIVGLDSAISDIQTADILVGTATSALAGEIVVGTSPGGELGGTWASPTVDATHSGSTHSAATDTHIADATDAHDASAISIADAGGDFTATDVEGALAELQADNEAHVAAGDPHTGYRKESDPRHLVTFSKTGNLSTGTGTMRWYNDTGVSITLDSARGSVGTAPASQSILVDVNNNGTSVWNATQANRITIAAAGNTDEGGAFDDATIADGEYITVDIDQVGSGTVGADLTVSIWGHNA